MNQKNEYRLLFFMLLGGLALRLLVSPYFTHDNDMRLWMFWAESISKVGFKDFFTKVSWTDYLPFYFYFLFLLEKISQTFQITGTLLFKMPAIIADLITTFIIFQVAGKLEIKNRLLVAALYLFNPAIFANSAMWGQIDGIGALLVTGALYFFIIQNEILLGLFLAMAILFKPLYLFLLPIFFIAQYRISVTRLIFLTLSIFNFTFLLTIPFVYNILRVPELIISRYQASLNQYQLSSVNAFNFWGMLGQNFISDKIQYMGISYHYWGLFLFGLVFGFLLLDLLLNKSIGKHYLKLATFALTLTFIAVFTFSTRAHERHLLTFFPLMVLFVTSGRTLLYSYILASVIYVINLYFAVYFLYLNGRFIFTTETVELYSAGIVIIALFLIYKYIFSLRSLIK